MADDFGMHPAVNSGIVRAFLDGLLTDSNLMAPCPAFSDAAALAKAHKIPVGLHATWTNDWDLTRWQPLTQAPSLVNSDGFFRSDVADAWAHADEGEALNELRAQYDAIEAEGIEMTHIAEHMGVDGEAGKGAKVMTALACEKLLPYSIACGEYNPVSPSYQWQSCLCTSGKSTNFDEVKALLKSFLFDAASGYHIWYVHPADNDPSLDQQCSPDHSAAEWARTYRVLDLKLLLDNEVTDWIKQLGFKMVSVTAAPVQYAAASNGH